jgi:two-component system cell cycle sensor histidine kinase/response regulator CckA
LGKEEKTICSHTDEKMQMDQEMRVLKEKLHELEKLEPICRLAVSIAHDFTNLLTIIKCNSQLLLRKLGERDPLKLDIEDINRAADRAIDLTRQLLALANFTPRK